MRKFSLWFFGLILICGVLFALLSFNIQSIKLRYLHTLYHNLKFLSTASYQLLPFIMLVVVVIVLSTRKWAFRVERLTIGGFNVLFDNPNHLFVRQIRTFLDTKRTLFKVDFEHDNFKETLDSYYETYKFLRDEIKILGDAKKKQTRRATNVKEAVQLYTIANEMIRELNQFLTKHQSDFRRWYTYVEKKDEEKFYLEPIGELQKTYPKYTELCDGFEHINEFFTSSVVQKFSIDVEKWGIRNA